MKNQVALLIEDERTELLARTALECADFRCDAHRSMTTLLRALRRDEHLAVVVDTAAPSLDCRALLDWRRHWLGGEIAVIAIGSDDGQSASRLLDLGADDFVTQPVRPTELVGRVRASSRRTAASEPGTMASVAGCSIDRAGRAIVSSSSRVALTARELALANVLFENAGRVVTRLHLSQVVWGLEPELASRSIGQHVYQLRRKIERCVGKALALRSIYGSGYLIDARE